MATLYLKKSASSGSYIEGKVEYEYTTSPKSNSSAFTAKYYVRKGNTDMTLTIPTDGNWGVGISFGGTSFHSVRRAAAVLEDWVYLYTYKTQFLHKADGTLSLNLGFDITAPTETSFEGHTTKGSVTIEFDPIAPASTVDLLECSTSYVDGTISAQYTAQDAAYYNRRIVYANIDGALKTIRTTDLGKKSVGQHTSNINFTATELQQIYTWVTKTAKVKIRVTFQTYLDSGYAQQFGDDSYREITLSLPLSIAPAVELSVSPVNSNAWIAKQKIYVAGLSGAAATLSATPGTKAELASTSIIYNGAVYDAVKLNVTTLKDSGSIEFSAKATDSRGRSATATETISVLSYGAPAITSINIERGTYGSSWAAAEDGPDLRVRFKTTLSLTANGNTYSAVFKLDNSTIIPVSGTVTGLSSGATCTVYFRNVDGEHSHSFTMRATDKVGETGEAAVVVPTMHVTIEYRANGKGIAFGKTAEKDAFECAWPAHFEGAVYIKDKITCPNSYSLRDFNINCDWADNAGHDLLVRQKDGLTTGLGWSGSGDDGQSYETVLDVRPKKANFRGTITAPRGRFTATNDLSGNERKDVALRTGDPDGQHIDMDTNEIQAKQNATTPGPLYLNLDGGDVYARGFRIPEIQRGSVRITPSAANTPTSLAITFEKEFSGTPTVIATPYTAVPGTTVVGVGINGANKTGCTIWVTRTNTTETVVHWIAIY